MMEYCVSGIHEYQRLVLPALNTHRAMAVNISTENLISKDVPDVYGQDSTPRDSSGNLFIPGIKRANTTLPVLLPPDETKDLIIINNMQDMKQLNREPLPKGSELFENILKDMKTPREEDDRFDSEGGPQKVPSAKKLHGKLRSKTAQLIRTRRNISVMRTRVQGLRTGLNVSSLLRPKSQGYTHSRPSTGSSSRGTTDMSVTQETVRALDQPLDNKHSSFSRVIPSSAQMLPFIRGSLNKH